jgi:hypothetical protein
MRPNFVMQQKLIPPGAAMITGNENPFANMQPIGEEPFLLTPGSLMTTMRTKTDCSPPAEALVQRKLQNELADETYTYIN